VDLQIRCIINKLSRNDLHMPIQNVGGVNGEGSRWKISQHSSLECPA